MRVYLVMGRIDGEICVFGIFNTLAEAQEINQESKYDLWAQEHDVGISLGDERSPKDWIFLNTLQEVKAEDQ